MNRAQQNRVSSRPAPRRRRYNILFLGNTGSGKASMKNKIVYNDFRVSNNIYDPTLDDSHQTHIAIGSEQCIVDIVELDYDDRYAGLFKPLIRQADGIILMYSICSPESFSVLEALWTLVKLVKVPEKKGLYVDVVGTMSDMWEKRSVKTEDGKALAERLNCGFSECSAKEGENCDVPIENLIRKIMVGHEQEQILRDAKRRKEDNEREERERKKNGILKRVLKRCVEIMTMGT
ncbi:putative member of ras oncogene family protein [Botrytis fragariae]|uniref:Putative member of ras oncogene family protein n=1 Tax=Botrytis fragariae TaxID=1964551 RepID=A0A8H6AQE1_9HELO|nr:putative member of ras oncogene family protein [Botrytis fragariae]KAF5871588.1 putative member of ras oncogene family protein [Botrytis fragariae]